MRIWNLLSDIFSGSSHHGPRFIQFILLGELRCLLCLNDWKVYRAIVTIKMDYTHEKVSIRIRGVKTVGSFIRIDAMECFVAICSRFQWKRRCRMSNHITSTQMKHFLLLFRSISISTLISSISFTLSLFLSRSQNTQLSISRSCRVVVDDLLSIHRNPWTKQRQLIRESQHTQQRDRETFVHTNAH